MVSLFLSPSSAQRKGHRRIQRVSGHLQARKIGSAETHPDSSQPGLELPTFKTMKTPMCCFRHWAWSILLCQLKQTEEAQAKQIGQEVLPPCRKLWSSLRDTACSSPYSLRLQVMAHRRDMQGVEHRVQENKWISIPPREKTAVIYTESDTSCL